MAHRSVEIPHLAFPFSRFEDGAVAVVEQDTTDHVMACENVIVRCPSGWRAERPEFGWNFPEFRNTMDLGHLAAALKTWEPRSEVDVFEKRLQELADTAAREISVEVEAG